MNICVLIPVFNEEATISQLVADIQAKDLPVVVIDDGSSDRSVELARQAGAEVIEQGRNYGKGHTLKAGIQHILNSSYDGALMMDGDGQHAVEDIDVFLKEVEVNPQRVINGNRMANSKGMPLTRTLTNRFMSTIISWAARRHIPDTQCGYRYIGVDVLKKIHLETEGFEIETEILIKASKLGFEIASVPVQTIYADETSSIRPFRDTLKFIRYYFKELFS